MIVCRPQFILLLDIFIVGSLSSMWNVSISCFRIIDDRSQTEEERKRNFGIVKRVRLQLKEREWKADTTSHGNSDAEKTNGIRTLRWFTGILFPLIMPSSLTAIHRHRHHLIVIVIVRCFFVPSSFRLSLSLIHSLAYSFVPSFTRVSLFPSLSLHPLSLSLFVTRARKLIHVSYIVSYEFASSSGWSVLLATIVHETDWLDRLRRSRYHAAAPIAVPTFGHILQQTTRFQWSISVICPFAK